MHMRSGLLIFLLVVCSSNASAQSDSSLIDEIRTASNAVYGELGGPALYYSLNYDRMLLPSLGVRAGFGFVEATDGHGAVMLPVFVNWFPDAHVWSDSKLEIDFGLVYHSSGVSTWFEDMEDRGTYLSFGLGYRYQSLEDGILFRITATPLFFSDQVFLFGGVSFGYAF
jgi:hypothetical protein